MLNTKRNEIFNANDVINSNDLRRRIVNIDSRFRVTYSDPPTDFYYRLNTTYKNVIRAKVVSVEVPNVSYVFSAAQYKNTGFTITAKDFSDVEHKVSITIPNGNYTKDELVAEINNQLIISLLYPYGIYIQLSYNTLTYQTTITMYGSVDITSGVWPPVSTAWVYLEGTYATKPASVFVLDFTVETLAGLMYNNGLGYNLGYRLNVYTVNKAGTIPEYLAVTSEALMDVTGDPYWFLSVDDFNAVSQQTNDNTFDCLAKIVLNKGKGNNIFNDSTNLLSNDVIFPSPIDITRVRIRLLDAYGNVVDLNDMNFSFSLELTEVMNTKLYEFYRNYIWLGILPSLPQDVRGAGVPLLGGRGP